MGLLPRGDITGNRQYAVGATFGPAEVAAEIATERQTVAVEVTGEQLLGLMEQALAALPQSSPKFLQFSGIRLKADLSQPAGGRVTQLTVQGSALDLTRTYTAAVTDTDGGREMPFR
ncbi:MAG: 5'-nucleotidase [Hyphomicrobiales bacterium]